VDRLRQQGRDRRVASGAGGACGQPRARTTKAP